MEGYIQISKLNDFIFCPHSIFLHGIYESFHENIYHENPQKQGKVVHDSIEKNQYSSASRYLQGTSVYSRKYHLLGKIDIFDTQKKSLIERKYKLKKLFDGHKYQLYAQYFCLTEMGIDVENLYIHSLSDNKRYAIPLPDHSEQTLFENIIKQMHEYSTVESVHEVNKKKCEMCIYRQLCHKSLC